MADLKLTEKKETFEQVLEMLNIIENMYLNKYLDLSEMNKWLIIIVGFYKKFYKKNDKDISVNDFLSSDEVKESSNMQDDEVKESSNMQDDIVKEYMTLFFKKYEEYRKIGDFSQMPSDEEFLYFVFKLESVEVTKEMLNPIFDAISFAVKRLHSRNQEIINDCLFTPVNCKIKELGLGPTVVTPNNISIVKQYVDRENGINNDLLAESEERERQESFWNDMVHEMCNLITGNKYDQLDDTRKADIEAKLYEICVTIIKYRLFLKLKDSFDTYCNDNNYSQLIMNIQTRRSTIEQKQGKMDSWNKVPITCLKEKMRSSLNAEIERLSREINELVSIFLKGFYDMYDMPMWLIDAGIYDDSKLFGEFDIDNLPPTIDKINDRDDYKYNEIILPAETSEEFNRLCIMAYKYLSSFRENCLRRIRGSSGCNPK